MLHVKTRVAPSLIHGLGLFAIDSIAKGEIIFAWNHQFGWCCGPIAFSLLPEGARVFLRRYGWRNGENWYLDIDDSRFINHSTTPNMIVTTDGVITSRASRDIKAGEELTEDYSSFDPDFPLYAHELTAPVAAPNAKKEPNDG